jgi:hypothetical protein
VVLLMVGVVAVLVVLFLVGMLGIVVMPTTYIADFWLIRGR